MAAPLRQQRHTHFRDDGSTHVRFIDAPSPNAMRPPSSGLQKPSAEPPLKKPRLEEKQDAAIDDATQAPVGEHRLRKEARRLLALRAVLDLAHPPVHGALRPLACKCEQKVCTERRGRSRRWGRSSSHVTGPG